jgi:adenosylcobinamide amidohydrolase
LIEHATPGEEGVGRAVIDGSMNAGGVETRGPTVAAAARGFARWYVHDDPRALVILLDGTRRALSWAPLGGGFTLASAIVNHGLGTDARDACEQPEPYLRRVVHALGLPLDTTIALMTGAAVDRPAVCSESSGDLSVTAFTTAGCSNALRVGDPATSPSPKPGTINLVVTVGTPLGDGALVEAVQIAAEAKAVATLESGAVSVVSGRRATGTGTDCIVVAAPAAPDPSLYCGKHTKLGELIGRAVLASCGAALSAARSRGEARMPPATS